MRAKSLLRYVLIICGVLLVLAACDRPVATTPPARANVLVIGNSFTYFNNGIDKQLAGLAPASRFSSIALGGYTLERHWNDPNTLQTLRQGGWGYVILQEQSQLPVFDSQRFREFAKAFDQTIKSSGAKTILLMTWERPDSVSYGVTTANLAAAYQTIGAELGAKVAPAGLAFARSLQDRPDLLLYSQDGHPTIYGTYLAACILYGSIFERSPVGNPYIDQSISPEIGAYLQKIAAASLGY